MRDRAHNKGSAKRVMNISSSVSIHRKWEDLCELAHRMGIEIRVEALPEEARISGGCARVAGSTIIILDRTLSLPERVDLLMRILHGHKLDDVYMPPYLREAMEGIPMSSGVE